MLFEAITVDGTRWEVQVQSKHELYSGLLKARSMYASGPYNWTVKPEHILAFRKQE